MVVCTGKLFRGVHRGDSSTIHRYGNRPGVVGSQFQQPVRRCGTTVVIAAVPVFPVRRVHLHGENSPTK